MTTVLELKPFTLTDTRFRILVLTLMTFIVLC